VVYVYPDIDAMSRAAARALIDRAREAVEAEGRCAIALSGGNTPRALYRLLATESARRMPWGQVDLFWGDERYVPADDPRSNFRMAKETLLDRIPIRRRTSTPCSPRIQIPMTPRAHTIRCSANGSQAPGRDLT